MTTLAEPRPWYADAACRKHPEPEIFFPKPGGSAVDARMVCAHCPVRRDCLLEALERERGIPACYRSGVWGGATPTERKRMDACYRNVCGHLEGDCVI